MTTAVIVAAVTVIVVLGVGGALTTVGPWYRALRKPSWNPPDWAFGPAWTVILGLAAWAGVLAWDDAADTASRARIIVLFGVNIVLHMLWSPLFFNFRRPDWALIEVPFLWLSIAALTVGLAPLSSLACWLLLPYLLWVSFAAFLNFTIVRMNAPFSAAQQR
jgi:benzodiazapine receptor